MKPAPPLDTLILTLRGQKVILDVDLAGLYQVETRVLIQAVKRNSDRFPTDFLFQLSAEEFGLLRSQSVISNAIRLVQFLRSQFVTSKTGQGERDACYSALSCAESCPR